MWSYLLLLLFCVCFVAVPSLAGPITSYRNTSSPFWGSQCTYTTATTIPVEDQDDSYPDPCNYRDPFDAGFDPFYATDYGDNFFSGFDASTSSYCLSSILQVYSSSYLLTATLSPTRFEIINDYLPTYSSPCCSTCTLDVRLANLKYWPTPAIQPNVTAIVDKDGNTFISPSVYVAFTIVSAYDLCGLVGATRSLVTLTFGQNDLSTEFIDYVADTTITKSFNYADFNNVTCTTQNDLVSADQRCKPELVFPSGASALQSVDPLWANCVNVFHAYDPPTALSGVAALLPVSTTNGGHSIPPTAKPSPDPQSIAPVTTAAAKLPPVTGPSPKTDPSTPQSTQRPADPSAVVPASPPPTLANTPPQSSDAKLESSIPNSDPNSQPPVGNGQSQPPSNPQTQPPSNPLSQPPSDPQSQVPSKPQSEAPSNTRSQPPSDPQSQESSNIKSQAASEIQSQSVGTILQSQEPTPQPTIGTPNQQQQPSQGVAHDLPVSSPESAVTPLGASLDPVQPSVALMGGEDITPVAGSSGAIIYQGQTVTQGAAPTIIGTVPISFASGSVFVNGKGAPIPTVAAIQASAPVDPPVRSFVVTAQNQAFSGVVESNRVQVSGSTITPGASGVSINGVQVSVDPEASYIVAGGQTQALPAAASPFLSPFSAVLVAGHSITVPVSGASSLIIGTQTISAKGPAVKISGTPVSLGTGVLIVGTSTMTLANSPSRSNSEAATLNVGGQDIIVPTSGAIDIVIGSQTLSVNGPTVTISGTPVALKAGSLVVGTSYVALAAQSEPSTIGVGGLNIAIPFSGASDLVIGSQTVYANGATAIVSGTPIALKPGFLIVGTSTIALAPQQTAAYFTFGGQTFVAEITAGAIDYILGGQTLTPNGAAITVDGTIVSLGSSKVVVGSMTEQIPTLTTTTEVMFGAVIMSGFGPIGNDPSSNTASPTSFRNSSSVDPFLGAAPKENPVSYVITVVLITLYIMGPM